MYCSVHLHLPPVQILLQPTQGGGIAESNNKGGLGGMAGCMYPQLRRLLTLLTFTSSDGQIYTSWLVTNHAETKDCMGFVDKT